MWKVSASPLRFEEALAWFREKVPIPDPDFRLLEERARQRAFFVSGVASLDLLSDVWGSLMQALEEGTPYREWARQATPVLEAAWGGRRPWHVETVFRTNVQHAYSAGRWAQLQSPAVRKSRPYLMYDAILDTRTTQICKARNGVVRPADDPWWASNWPPLHYNCRSGVRALTREEAGRRGITQDLPTEPPLEGFGAAPDALDWADGFALRERLEMGETWEPAFVGPVPAWESYGLPGALEPKEVPAPLLPTAEEVGEAVLLEMLRLALGGLPRFLKDPTGLGAVLDSRLLSVLALDGRERYLALLPDLVQKPDEVWLYPVRKTGGRAVVFRVVYVKTYRVDGQDVALAATFHRGVLAGLEVYTPPDGVNEVRQGILRRGAK